MSTRRSGRPARGSVEALPFLNALLGSRVTLGALLESIRVGEGISSASLAKTLGISRSHLCDIEKGRKVVSPERAVRFAKLLGYAPEQFVRLALQDELDHAGLPFKVEVSAA